MVVDSLCHNARHGSLCEAGNRCTAVFGVALLQIACVSLEAYKSRLHLTSSVVHFSTKNSNFIRAARGGRKQEHWSERNTW